MTTIATSISSKLLELATSNLVHDFVGLRVMPSWRTNNFPWKWTWPRSRDPTIVGIRSKISSKLLELETSNLVSGFGSPLLFDCQFLRTIAIVNCEAVRSAILSTAWLLVVKMSRHKTLHTLDSSTHWVMYIDD